MPSQESFQNFSDDVMLQPQHIKTEDSSLATVEVSDSSSLIGDFEFLDSTSGTNDNSSPDLDLLSQEINTKGPLQSDLELRYFLQIFLEAGCLEWALILSIVLRDALAVVRTVNTASMTDTPLEIVGRMREGLSYLELWADTECIGYRSFFHAIRGQIKMLAKLSEQSPPKLQLNTMETMPETIENGTLSPTIQSINSAERDLTQDNTNGVLKEERPSECSVS